MRRFNLNHFLGILLAMSLLLWFGNSTVSSYQDVIWERLTSGVTVLRNTTGQVVASFSPGGVFSGNNATLSENLEITNKLYIGNQTDALQSLNMPVTISASGGGLAIANRAASHAGGGAFINLYSYDNAAMGSGDRLGGFIFGGSSNATKIRNTAGVFAYTNSAWNATNFGSYIQFQATSEGTTNRVEKMRLTGGGVLAIGTTTPALTTGDAPGIDLNAAIIRQRIARTPSNSTAACNAGEMTWDTNSTYRCVSTNRWKKFDMYAW